jgi:diguanylate cyclase (GGDEF)-like protein/PAS domain S-box-containing protein
LKRTQLRTAPLSHEGDDSISGTSRRRLAGSEADPALDAFAARAARSCGVSAAFVAVAAGGSRLTVRAAFGVSGARGVAFRAAFRSAALAAPAYAEIGPCSLPGFPDAASCATVPLARPGAAPVGVLCVADGRPRSLSGVERATLERLGKAVGRLVAARSASSPSDRERLDLLCSVLDSSPDPVGVVAVADRRPVVVYVNPAFTETFGYHATDLLGGPPDLVLGPKTDREKIARLERAAFNAEPFAEIIHLYGSNGEAALFDVRERPVDPVHRLVVFHDMRPIQQTLEALSDANQRLGSLLANNNEAVLTVDSSGTCLDLNPAALALLGVDRGTVLGAECAAGRLFPGGDGVPDALRSGKTIEYEAAYERRDGRRLDLQCRAVPMIVRDAFEGAYVIVKDVTEANRVSQLIAEQAKRTHALYLISSARGTSNAKQIDAALELVLDVFDMQYAFMCEVRGDEMHLLNVVGEGLQEIGDVFPLEQTRVSVMLRHGDVYAVDDVHLPENRAPGVKTYPGWHGYLAVPLVIFGRTYGAIGFVSRRAIAFNEYDREFARLVGALVASALERQMQARRLDELAYIDMLTELPNRAKFMLDVEAEIAESRRKERPFALHFIDLDGFKLVNDRAGHSVGDLALKEVARRLRGLCGLRGVRGVPARLGGDEFVLLQSGFSSPSQARALGNRIVAGLSEPYFLDGHGYELGASVGVALFPRDGADARTLLCSADAALYRAKAFGKRRVELSRRLAAPAVEEAPETLYAVT